MKLLVGSLLSLCVFTSQAMATDVVKVNAVVAKILNGIVAQDDFVENLEIKLDAEKTNLEKPSLGVSIVASTKQAAWSKELTKLTVDLEIDTEKKSEEDTRVFGELSVALETNVLSFLKFYFDENFCVHSEVSFGRERASCTQFAVDIKNAENFQQEVVVFKNAFKTLKNEIDAELEVLKTKFGSETGVGKKEEIQYSIDNLEVLLGVFSAIQISDEEDRLYIVFKLGGFLEEDETSVLNVFIEATETSVKAGAQFSFVLDAAELETYSLLPVQMIQILEQNIGMLNEGIKLFALSYIEILKETVADEN